MTSGYHFLKGYRTVEAQGNHIEKFLNLSFLHRIYLWNIKRIDETKVVFCVSNRGFSLMQEYAEKTKTRLQILSSDGISYLWKRLLKRRVFLGSAAVVLLVILLSSSFIWTVDIEGDGFVSHDLVKEKLSQYGLGVGSFRRNFDFTAISNRLINDFDEILWANAELSGTRLKVTLIPRTKAPAVIPKEIPVNIVAKKDGFIKEIFAENGEAMVKAGDTVVKDQILISGLVPSPAVGSRYLHAIGRVQAVTWSYRELEKKLYHYEKIFTGRKISRREIELPFVKIPLYFKESIDFYNYDSIIKERNFLFLTFRETVLEEYTLSKNNITIEQAVTEAVAELSEQMQNDGVTAVISRKTDYFEVDSETIRVTLLAECEEELGVKKEIPKPQSTQ